MQKKSKESAPSSSILWEGFLPKGKRWEKDGILEAPCSYPKRAHTVQITLTDI